MSCKFLVENLQISCKLLAKHTKALLRWASRSCSSHDCPALRHPCPTVARAHSGSGNVSTIQEEAERYLMLYTFGECGLDTQLHVLSRSGQSV